MTRSIGAADTGKLEGLGNAALVLTTLLKARYTGEDVIKPRRPVRLLGHALASARLPMAASFL